MAVNPPPVVLDVWKGDWGLPSVDLECLRWMAHVKFSGHRLETRKTNNPFWTPNGQLPVGRCGSRVFAQFRDLSEYIKEKNIDPDYGLDAPQLADIVSYHQMVREKLYPALVYVWWADHRNFNNLTRPWYARALPFPLNFYYPSRYMNEGNLYLQTLFGDGFSPNQELETIVYREAEKCLTTLSVKLGDSNYFLGTRPTSIDAILLAYLAPLLKAPFLNNTLQNHLKACTNLHKYVSRILLRYFPEDLKDYETKKKEEAAQEADEFPNKRRNIFFASVVAFFAMFSYAMSTGIVQVMRNRIDFNGFSDEDDEYDDF